MAEREFADYSEIARMDIKSQQDLIMKYIAGEALMESYTQQRKESSQTDSPSLGGMVTPEERQTARDYARDFINDMGWNVSDDSKLRRLRNRIDHFFTAIGFQKISKADTQDGQSAVKTVSTDIFKKNGQYVMTPELIDLFEFIIENEHGFVGKVIKRKFDKVNNQEYFYLLSRVLDAIIAAPCSKEDKLLGWQVINNFTETNHIDVPRPHNGTVDFILRIVWEKISEQGWKPNFKKFKCPSDDIEWAVVVGRVYSELHAHGILVPNPDSNTWPEEARLVSDKEFPPQA